MFEWLRKKSKINNSTNEVSSSIIEVIEKEEPKEIVNEVATIQVRDLKQYLVDEFEEREILEEALKFKDEKIEILTDYKYQHDAALVIVDEYKTRLNKKDDRIKELYSLNQDIRSKLDEAFEQKNTMTIQLNSLKGTNKEMKKELDDLRDKFDSKLEKQVEIEIKEQVSFITTTIENILTNTINWHKGNLSKAKALEYVNEAVKNYRSEDNNDDN